MEKYKTSGELVAGHRKEGFCPMQQSVWGCRRGALVRERGSVRTVCMRPALHPDEETAPLFPGDVLKRNHSGKTFRYFTNECPKFTNDGSDFTNECWQFSNDGFGFTNDGSGLRNDGSGLRNDRPALRNDGSGLRNDHPALRNDGSELRNDHPALRKDGSELRNERSEVRNDGCGTRNEVAPF